MVTLIIDGVSVSAPSVDRCLAAFQDVMGRPGLVITDPAPAVPDSTVSKVLRRDASQPMGFAISPMTGQMTAVA